MNTVGRCLDDPTPWNCRPIGPGFGVHGGAKVDNCFSVTRAEAKANGWGMRWGYYWLDYKKWKLHYAGWNGTPYPSWDLANCKRQSDECFAVGDIENTEGSPDGP
jgi:hypothetical protein